MRYLIKDKKYKFNELSKNADNIFKEKHLVGSATCLPVNSEDGFTYGVWVEYLEPIPLTKEILEKIGFACTQKADEDEMGAAYECWSFRDGLFSIEFEPEVVMLEVHNGGENGDAVRTITYYTDNDIMYLHELQQALKLCGINKNIEL